MLSLFNFKKSETRAEAYGRQKEVATSDVVKKRMKLAKDKATQPEILYFLADQDNDPKVRRAVAENESTPTQAQILLAEDDDIDVRFALAGRLMKILPDISKDEQSQVYKMAVDSLSMLALDEVLKIRIALASTLKDLACTPPKIAAQLAKDVERDVSEPILKYCVALSDKDILEILKGHPDSWRIQAISGRESVSEAISDAIFDTGDVDAGKTLLKNKNTIISEKTYENIAQKAETIEEWHKPIAMREKLPVSIVEKLAAFVDESIKNTLLERGNFDQETIDRIGEVFDRRLKLLDDKDSNPKLTKERIEKLAREKKLGEDIVMDAIGIRDYEMAIAAIAALLNEEEGAIEKVIDARAPKSIIAMVWKANLTMRTAIALQRDVAKIPHREILYAKNGTDFPIPEAELESLADFLGI